MHDAIYNNIIYNKDVVLDVCIVNGKNSKTIVFYNIIHIDM